MDQVMFFQFLGKGFLGLNPPGGIIPYVPLSLFGIMGSTQVLLIAGSVFRPLYYFRRFFFPTVNPDYHKIPTR